MRKCLVTAAQTALAFKVKNNLNEYEVLLGDHLPLPATASLLKLPDPASGTYLHELLKLCLAEGIERVFALRRAELIALQHSGALFAEYGISLALPAGPDLNNCPEYQPDRAASILVQDDRVYWQDTSGNLNFLVLY